MPPFTLTPNLMTGIPVIDQQHGELFDIANEVMAASQTSMHPDLFDLALSFLVGYTAYHFAAEEAVMAKIGYPGATAHSSVHDRLRGEVASIVLRVQRQGPSQQSQSDITRLLEDWVVVHVRESDRAFARFVREKSIDVTTLTLPTVESLKCCGSLAIDFDERFAAGVAALQSARG